MEAQEVFKPTERKFAEYITPKTIEELQQDTTLKTLQKVVAFHGFPYDEGTRRNNGARGGGEQAPLKFRELMKQQDYYPTQFMKSVQIYDTGDLPKKMKDKELTLEEAHLQLTNEVSQILSLNNEKYNVLPFIFGGSNDQSYSNAKGLLKAYKGAKIAVINVDAHFDVRPLNDGKAHSGSPFRQILLDEDFINSKSRFVEFATQGSSSSAEHYKFVHDKNFPVYWLEKDIRRYNTKHNCELQTQAGQMMMNILEELSNEVDHIFFSFDIDSIHSAICPGVSSPAVVGGLTELEAIELCFIAGRTPKVRLIDMSEYNPAVECENTGKLVTNLFYSVVKGMSLRNYTDSTVMTQYQNKMNDGQKHNTFDY